MSTQPKYNLYAGSYVRNRPTQTTETKPTDQPSPKVEEKKIETPKVEPKPEAKVEAKKDETPATPPKYKLNVNSFKRSTKTKDDEEKKKEEQERKEREKKEEEERKERERLAEEERLRKEKEEKEEQERKEREKKEEQERLERERIQKEEEERKERERIAEEERKKKEAEAKRQRNRNKKRKFYQNEEEDEEEQIVEIVKEDDEDEWNQITEGGKKKKINEKQEKEKEEKRRKKEEALKKKREEEERIAKQKAEEEERIRKEKEEEERRQKEEEERKRKEEEERIAKQKAEEEERLRKEKEEEERKQKEEQERIEKERIQKEEEERKRKEKEEKELAKENLWQPTRSTNGKIEGGKSYSEDDLLKLRPFKIEISQQIKDIFRKEVEQTLKRSESAKNRSEQQKPVFTPFSNLLDAKQKEQAKLLTIINQLCNTTDLGQAAETIAHYLKTEEDINDFTALFIKRCANESKFTEMYVKLIAELRSSHKLNTQIPNGAMVLSKSLIDNVYEYYKKIPRQKKRTSDMTQQELIELEESEEIEKLEYKGTVEFIGELYLKNVVDERLPLICMNELVEDATDEIKLEAYIRLCTKVFNKIKNIEKTSPNYEEMNKAYNHANELKDDARLSKRMQLLMLDVVDMKNSNGKTIIPLNSNPNTPAPHSSTPNFMRASSNTPNQSKTPNHGHQYNNRNNNQNYHRNNNQNYQHSQRRNDFNQDRYGHSPSPHSPNPRYDSPMKKSNNHTKSLNTYDKKPRYQGNNNGNHSDHIDILKPVAQKKMNNEDN